MYTKFFSQMDGEEHREVREYLTRMFLEEALNADSMFGRRARAIDSICPRVALPYAVDALKLVRYDVMFSYVGDERIGHIFFQRNRRDWCTPHHFVRKDKRERGYGYEQLLIFIEEARKKGAGNIKTHNWGADSLPVQKMMERLKEERLEGLEVIPEEARIAFVDNIINEPNLM